MERKVVVGEYMLKVSGRPWSRHICATLATVSRFQGERVNSMIARGSPS